MQGPFGLGPLYLKLFICFSVWYLYWIKGSRSEPEGGRRPHSGEYSAKHLQILQNIQFQIQIQCFHNFRKCPDICTESGFYKVHDECFLWQHWIQMPKQKQNISRQPVQSCPLCRPVFCKIWNANFLKIFTFSQEFLLSWDKDLDFLLAGHWEYIFLLLLEFFPHVIW